MKIIREYAFLDRTLNQEHTHRAGLRLCNICKREFTPRTELDRYCFRCKEGSKLSRFSEWLPEAEPTLPEQLCA